ncbi:MULTISPECIES: DUF3349 domain-containing protein [Streptomyces]|uniref:DUF3349 domain-containing protein n=1 Tax=Streptomyces TaxID=1883 RepID=UPI00140C3DC5|nr:MULTISPECIES: DUF3349 domain-containing protein [Streptomyces]MDH6227469.1 hypothetical protein [Streptomyces sp. MJP52]
MEPHLTEVVALLRRAFPGGIDADDRLPLLAVLSEGLCEENAGRVGAAFLGTDRHAVENDAARPVNRARRERAAVLRGRLARHGWDPDED